MGQPSHTLSSFVYEGSTWDVITEPCDIILSMHCAAGNAGLHGSTFLEPTWMPRGEALTRADEPITVAKRAPFHVAESMHRSA